jgi:diphthamide synthase (EF-2-diphthine--ammonia ligase)
VAHQEVNISDVVKQAESLGVPLLGVPLHAGPSSSYKARVEAALRFVSARTKVQRLCFGDLHLEHIRQWRFDNLTAIADEMGAELHFPVWKVPYDELMQDLLASEVPCVISAVTISEEHPEAEELLTVGAVYGPELTDKLPPGVDKFGEAGEFHTLAQVWLAEGSGLSGLT